MMPLLTWTWARDFVSLDSPPLWVVLPLAQYAVCFYIVVGLYEKRELIGAAWDASHRFWRLRDSWAAVLSGIASTLGRLSRGLYAVSRRVSRGPNGERAMQSGRCGRSGWSPG